MINLIPIEPINDTHGALIVDAFNRLFVEGGGCADSWGGGTGRGGGLGYGYGDGYGDGYGCDIPEEWQVK